MKQYHLPLIMRELSHTMSVLMTCYDRCPLFLSSSSYRREFLDYDQTFLSGNFRWDLIAVCHIRVQFLSTNSD